MSNKKTQLSFIIVIIFFLAGFFLINHLTPARWLAGLHPSPKTPLLSPLSRGINLSPLTRGGLEGLRGGGERSENIKYIKIAGQVIKVELALTSGEQAQGLSGRQGLNYNEGMLFVFSQSGNYPFWMKEMNFPIDIIWLGEDLQVVYIKKDARPESYPETYGPDEEAEYVLEVVSGFADKNNLQMGDTALLR